jgi:hypothetical protein
MAVPALGPYRLVFLLAVPLAWAVLLMFHPAPDPDDIYGSLRDESTQWLVVHVGTLLFIGLMGAALFLLVSDLSGLAATVSRVAANSLPQLLYARPERHWPSHCCWPCRRLSCCTDRRSDRLA